MSRGPETYAERNRRLLDEKVRELRAEGWDVLPRRDRDRALSERDDANDELALLRSEVKRMREALTRIHREGKVCDGYELCGHRACQSSYNAWAIADAALYNSTREDQNG